MFPVGARLSVFPNCLPLYHGRVRGLLGSMIQVHGSTMRHSIDSSSQKMQSVWACESVHVCLRVVCVSVCSLLATDTRMRQHFVNHLYPTLLVHV